MRPVRVAIDGSGGTGVSPVVPIDIYQKGPITVALTGVQGVVSVDIDYTLDDVWSPSFNPATAEWFPTGIQAAAAAASEALVDANNNPIIPTAIRATNGGAGTAVLVVVQSGITG